MGEENITVNWRRFIKSVDDWLKCTALETMKHFRTKRLGYNKGSQHSRRINALAFLRHVQPSSSAPSYASIKLRDSVHCNYRSMEGRKEEKDPLYYRSETRRSRYSTLYNGEVTRGLRKRRIICAS